MMSHYSVAVFANSPADFDRLLDPYNETKHLVSKPVDEQVIKKQYEEFLVQNPSWDELGFEYYLKQMDYIREEGQICTRENPNAKWDWYSLDGRAYMFSLRDESLDGERMKDYDYDSPDPDAPTKQELEYFWDVIVDGKPLDETMDEPFTIYSREYYIARYGSKERYVQLCSQTRPYAFITPDGVWHSPGTVGWFAMDDATSDSLIEYAEEWDKYVHSDINPYVNFVDCHI